MSQPINVGVIGTGRIGAFHVETLTKRLDGVNVKAVCDFYLPSAEDCAKKFGIPLASSKIEDIIDDPEIDAVIICSSTDTHADYIQAAAKAGKHIFCEKPIDLDLKKIDETLAVVKECGVKLQVGFNRRFDPNFARVRQGIEKGEIGDLHFLRVASRDPAPPPAEYVPRSGGLFRDMMIHDFDMVRFITGCEVEEVYASGAVLVDPAIGEAGDIDTAVVNLKFTNGALGIIDNSRKAVYGYDQRIEAFGSGGMLEAKNVESNTVVLSTDKAIQTDLIPLFFVERYTAAYVNEFQAFVTAIAEDKPVPVTGNDGRMPVIIALAAMKSLKENRPVKLSEIAK